MDVVFLHKSFFGNGKKMGCLCRSLLAGIDLNHARDIERVDASKRIGGNEHDATICVDFFLRITEFDRLEDCRQEDVLIFLQKRRHTKENISEW